jgi:hypothetical protein
VKRGGHVGIGGRGGGEESLGCGVDESFGRGEDDESFGCGDGSCNSWERDSRLSWL